MTWLIEPANANNEGDQSTSIWWCPPLLKYIAGAAAVCLTQDLLCANLCVCQSIPPSS